MPATVPQVLYSESSCYRCFGTVSDVQLMRLALLARIARAFNSMPATDPQTLMAWGKCFQCNGEASVADMMEIALLDMISQIMLPAPTPAEVPTAGDLAYGAVVVVDFDSFDYQTVALAGDINFSATANRPAAGYAKAVAVIIEADGSDRNLAFNANWTFLGTAPATIAANKVGVLSLSAVGPNETDIVASYHVED